MVSQSEHVPIATTNPTVTDDRGIREHVATTSAVSYPAGYVSDLGPPRHSFGGSIIAGSLVAISISLLSYALMFGCRVGVYNATGAVAMSWGAGIWICVTAAIALYVGGMVASNLGRPYGLGWAYGLSVWGLTVPLSFVLAAVISMGAGIAYGMTTTAAVAGTAARAYGPGHLFTVIQLPTGLAWTLFISLALGLIFGILGGMSYMSGENRDVTVRP
jgi:hypothetical protein